MDELTVASMQDCSKDLGPSFDAELNSEDFDDNLVRNGRAISERMSADDAISLCERVIGMNPSVYWPYRVLAKRHMESGRLDASLDAISVAIRLNPASSGDALCEKIVDGLRREGREGEARNLIARVLERSEPGWAYKQLSRIERKNGNLDLSLELARKGYETTPGDQYVAMYYFTSLVREGRLDEAEAGLAAAVGEHGDSWWARYSVACLRMKEGRAEDAAAEAEASLRLKPGNHLAQGLLEELRGTGAPGGSDCDPALYSKPMFGMSSVRLEEEWFRRRPVIGYLGGADGIYSDLCKALGESYDVIVNAAGSEADYVLVPAEAMEVRGVGASDLVSWTEETGLDHKRMFVLTGEPDSRIDCRGLVFEIMDRLPGVRMFPLDEKLKASLDARINLDRSIPLSEFSVKAHASGSTLSSEIILGEGLAGLVDSMKYRFQVFLDRKVVFRSESTKVPEFEIQLQGQGAYMVQGTVYCGGRSFSQKSNSVCCYSDEALEAAERILSVRPFYNPGPVHIHSREPFQDIVIHLRRGSLDIGDAVSRVGASLQWEGLSEGNAVLLYSQSAEAEDGGVVATSGFVESKGRGCYVRATAKDGRIDVVRDICSFGQLFVYESATDAVIANHYYTLLRVLTLAGVKVEVDHGKMEMTLSVVRSNMMAQNNFSRMDVVGVMQVSAEYSVSVVGGNVVYVRSPMGGVLDGRFPLSYGEYLSMLELASSEIIESVLAACSGKGPFQLDLTGGLDSRAVFSALTNTDVPKDGIEVNTAGPLDSDDVEIALEVNSLYNYGYRRSPYECSMDGFSSNDNYWRNKFMGRIYSTSRNDVFQAGVACRISGGVGDALARPAFANRMYGTKAEYADSPRELAYWVWQAQIASYLVTDSESAEETFLDMMEEEIRRTSGASDMERYGLNYVYFRNAYHFDPEITYDHGERTEYPLQNLTLFELNHRTHDVFSGTRLEMELINSLNPVLSSVRFENKKDRRAYEDLKNQLLNPPLKSYRMSPDLASVRGKWESSRRVGRILTSKPVKCCTFQMEAAVLLNRLRILFRVEEGRYRRTAVSLLLHLAKNMGDRYAFNSIYNRVSSVLDQIHMTEEPDRGAFLLDASDLYVPDPSASLDELEALNEKASSFR